MSTPAFVQLAGLLESIGPSSGVAVTVTGTHAGNLLAILCENQGSGGAIAFTGVTDSQGNTYKACAGATASGTPSGSQTQLAMFFTKNIPGGSFTLHPAWTGAAGAMLFAVVEISGADAFDSGGGSTGVSATASTGAFSTHQSGLVVAGTINAGSGTGAGAGYTLIEVTPSFEAVLEYLPTVPFGSQTATAALGGSQAWGIVAGSFYRGPSAPLFGTDA